VALFAVIAAVAFLILGGVFTALVDSQQGFTFVDAVVASTQCVQAPLVSGPLAVEHVGDVDIREDR